MKTLSFSRLCIAIIVGGLLVLSGCDQARQPLKVASHVWPGYEFMHLANALGELDPNLVELVDTSSAPDTLMLLLEGKVDAGALTLDEVLRAHDQGLPLSVVLVFNISAGADVLLARTDIDSLDKLQGRRIGVETGAVGAIMLDRALLAAGLADPTD